MPGSHWSTNPLLARDGQTGEIYYAATDQLGTATALIKSSGQIVWKAEKTAFGKTSTTAENNAAGNPVQFNLRFPGQYEDTETGLHYNWNRYYDAGIGRYMNEDPIRLRGGLNVYQYALGNSVRYLDPYGLFCMPAWSKGMLSGFVGGFVSGLVSSGGNPWVALGGGLFGAAGGLFSSMGAPSVAAGAVAGAGSGGGVKGGLIGGAASAVLSDSASGSLPNAAGGAAGGFLGGWFEPHENKWGREPNGKTGKNMMKGGLGGFAGGFAEDFTNMVLDEVPRCDPSSCNGN